MLVGIPKEIKDNENRVSTTPAGVAEYVARGHQVIVERSAGVDSGFADAEYEQAGAELVGTNEEVYARSELLAKVKEPTAAEYELLRENQILYAYLHLAADEVLTRTLMERQVTSVAYETVELPNRTLPLLTPMSEVAGRMSIQIGATYLQKTNGGRGLLLGGVAGVLPAKVVIIGGGIVGTCAAQMALGLGANVTLLDVSVERLRYLDQVLHGRINTLTSNRQNIASALLDCDLLIGAVLIPGARAPKIVTSGMVASMPDGAVIVDVAVDQGGCIETVQPTSHSDPTYVVDGVVHYCVTNMPGAVPRTSTFALSNATLPYGLFLADNGVDAFKKDGALASGVNIYKGKITYQAVADAFGLEYVPLDSLL